MQETQVVKPTRPAAANGKTPRRNGKIPLFFNREMSWLDFNARVLAEAQNEDNPLLERLKFLAIFSNNLDEFFMVYVPGMRQRASEETGLPLTEGEIVVRLREMQAKLQPMIEALYACFDDVKTQLSRHGVCVMRHEELSETQREHLKSYFEKEVFPVLTPLAVDPGHPFPYISNLSLSLAVVVRDPRDGQEHFARVKVPSKPVLPRLVPVPGEKWQFVLLEDLIMAHLGSLFTGMDVRAVYPFRVTRNADLEIADEAVGDLMEMIEEQLAQRRFGEVERLEVSRAMPDAMRRKLIEELETATEEEVYYIDGPLNLSEFFPLTTLNIPELRDPSFTASVPPALRGHTDMFTAIRQGDILLHHPYESFGCVTDFLRRAADDPKVLTIKHTLYRTSGDSPILGALIDAAENGKQVACLVELKARFDEENNITWAKHLEKSGVHVVYGLMGLKTHCKVTLVVRREEDGLRRYVHVGTGNYNPKTAAVYTDVGLLTCAEGFGADATELFNFLTGYSRQESYRKFLVAPVTLRPRLLEMVHREIEKHTAENPGRITAKMNSLVDTEIIRALYAASQAGVQVDLIVRGMCCLRPGVLGLSENIRVMSVVGRFLEHSRIFNFHNGGDEEIYIGSADWMGRNLDRRVEVVAPIDNPILRQQLKEGVLQVMLADTTQAWDLQPDGQYLRRQPKPGAERFSAQQHLMETLGR